VTKEIGAKTYVFVPHSLDHRLSPTIQAYLVLLYLYYMYPIRKSEKKQGVLSTGLLLGF